MARGTTVWLTVLAACASAWADDPLENPAELDPITITADISHDWRSPHDVEVWILRGRCAITQGETKIDAQQMVLWVQRDPRNAERSRIQVYLEDNVRVERPGRTASETALYLEMVTRAGTTFNVRRRLPVESVEEDPLYARARTSRAERTRKTAVRQTQYVAPSDEEIGPQLQSSPIESAPPGGVRRIRVFQRSAIPYNVFSFQSTNTTPAEQVWILSGGVNLLIDGIEGVGTIDLSADRMVIWTQSAHTQDFSAETLQTKDTPLQVYLEGNIIARQGENELRASQAFYDAREDRAIMLNAELKSKVPNLPVSLRIRAERLRQLSEGSFHAQQAWVSTSRFGIPGYRLQSSDVFFEQRLRRNPFQNADPSALQINPETGLPQEETIAWVTTLNTSLLLQETPVFFTPIISGPAEDPNIPLKRLTGGHDRVFGTQLYTAWNLFKLLGQETPEDTRLDLLADYLSDRGPAIGLDGDYAGHDLFGLTGAYKGKGNGYFIYDTGLDNLGEDRRALEPKQKERGRVQLRHRQDLENDLTLQGEVGFLSDRNFQEQYYENEFDTGKDNETLLYLKQQRNQWAWSLMGQVRLNDFDTQTEWLPRADAYFLGEPLLGGWLTWSSHSSAGLAGLRPGEAPTDQNDLYDPLPFVSDSEGGVLMTRHELSAPFNLGPVNLVPYVMGEAAYWSEDFNGDSIDRLYGSAGLRGSMFMQRTFPQVESSIFGLHGLAHKMIFDFDYSYSQATEDLANIPQYNAFDDLAQYRFRNRLLTNTFGGVLPPEFDPRFYAVRMGSGQGVTSPYHELVDDMHVLRFGWRHRLQTHRGPVTSPRVVDWMTLDLDAAYFPDADRDNFGEDLGLLSARYSWNVGDRTTLLASAFYDLFDNAQQLWNVGMVSQRSQRGSVYVGVRQVKGAGLDSQIVTASYSYRMSPKWIGTIGTAYDLAENMNRGQSLTLTRIGADFLVHVGANYDQSKDNAGIMISLEPRWFPFTAAGTQLGSLLDTDGSL